jgi:septal ring factor EnvC (AmiA/AmiB activator)
MNPNEAMSIIAEAIQKELAEIHSRSQFLEQLQNELLSITQMNNSELNNLHHQKATLLQHEQQLKAEIHRIREELARVNNAIIQAERDRAHKVNELAQRSRRIGLFDRPHFGGPQQQ